MPRYVDWVRSGDIVPNQTIARLVDTPVIAVLDGRHGFGQIVAPQAVDIGVEKAKAAGLSAVVAAQFRPCRARRRMGGARGGGRA